MRFVTGRGLDNLVVLAEDDRVSKRNESLGTLAHRLHESGRDVIRISHLVNSKF
jgi:hypothetical protein